ncbi:NUDIX domain-containing protein [Granulosicoccus sp.]|nr:NUDIX domain-containing protein [Granulosicoccus sp.]MDB4223425.1 NUDIX domain-containing protein [Granulosicoccus sp.]
MCAANVKIESEEILSDDWYLLKKTTFKREQSNGQSQTVTRETYDRGNGATILLYNLQHGTVVLTKQFRYPTYVNGNVSGDLIETAAGLLDSVDPATRIRREAEEETGFSVNHVTPVFEAYMSPGSVTERLYFFIAEYEESDRTSKGGGIQDEGEDIEVLEIDFSQAMSMIDSGEICDGKTIMLLQYAALNLFTD